MSDGTRDAEHGLKDRLPQCESSNDSPCNTLGRVLIAWAIAYRCEAKLPRPFAHERIARRSESPVGDGCRVSSQYLVSTPVSFSALRFA